MSEKIILIPQRPLPELPPVKSGTALAKDNSVVSPSEVVEGLPITKIW